MDRRTSRHHRAIPVLIIALVFALAARSSVVAGSLPLIIVGADAQLEADTRVILNAAHDELVRASGEAILDTIRVVYVGRHQSFDSVVGARFPDWGVAAAVAERHLIAVRSPLEYPLGRSLRETLRHELAHLHLDMLCGLHQLPRWMHEGYAQQFAHEWVFGDDFLIQRAVLTNSLIDLRDIDGVNSFAGTRAQLAYSESYQAMSYFLATYGWDGLLIYCRTVRAGGNWDDAFRASIGADYAAFQSEFRALMRSRYNWVAFFGDTALFWVGLAAVFVILYMVKRRRSAKRRAEWEREEALEDALYAPFDRHAADTTAPPPQEPES
jgi:hypothetical protein